MPTLKDVLDRSPLPTARRAQVWDIVSQAQTPADLQSQLDALGLPQSLKADLWDARFAPSAPTPAAEPESQGLLGGAWQTAKNVGSAALEAIGRPAELVSGTVAGALAPERDLTRGVRAFFEPLVGGTQQESFSKVIQEVSPEFAKAHPYLTTAAGFTGDVFTDPTNLVFGAGVARGLAKKGLVKAGMEAGAAERALLIQNPVRTAFETKAVPAMTKAAVRAGQALPFLPAAAKSRLALESVGRGAGGRTIPEIVAIEKGRMQGEIGAGLASQAERLKTLEALSPEDLSRVSQMVAEPLTAESQALRQRPELAAAADAMKELQHNRYLRDTETMGEALKREAAAQNLPVAAWATRQREILAADLPKSRIDALLQANPTLTEKQAVTRLVDEAMRLKYVPGGAPLMAKVEALPVKADTLEKLSRLTPLERRALETRLATFMGDTGVLDPQAYTTLSPKLQKLLKTLDAETSRVENGVVTRIANLKTLHFVPDVNGALEPFVSTELPNYVLQATRGSGGLPVSAAMKPGLGSAERRQRTWQENLAEGGITNAAELIMRREAASARARADRRIYQRLFDEFGSAEAQQGFRKLSKAQVAKLPDELAQLATQRYLPNAAADELERLAVRMFDPVAAEGVFTQTLKIWKTLVTAGNAPGHQLVNLSGNTANMYAIGMSVPDIGRHYVQAFRAMRRTPGAADRALLNEFQQLGLGGKMAGEAGEFQNLVQPLKTSAAEAMTAGTYNPLNPEAAYYRTLRNLNQNLIEDPAKFAVYRWARQQGKTTDEAALLVKKALFDYSDLSDFEKQYLRNVIPFYTWTRKNIPLQLATLATRPSRINNQRRLVEAAGTLADLQAENPLNQEGIPEYAQSEEFFRLPGTSRTLVPSRLPLFDVQALNASELGERAAFLMSPGLRVPAEVLLQRRLATGEPITSTRETQPSVLQRLTGLGVYQTPQGPRTSADLRYLTEQVPLLGGAITRSVASQGRPETDAPELSLLAEILARSFGMAPTTITPAQQQATIRRKRLQEREARRMARRRGDTNE